MTLVSSCDSTCNYINLGGVDVKLNSHHGGIKKREGGVGGGPGFFTS